MTPNSSPRSLFTEQQRFTSPWIWAIVIFSASFCLWPAIQEYVFNSPLGGEPLPVALHLLLFLSAAFVVFLFWSFRLDTKIDPQGIEYRFRPLHLKSRRIEWSDVKSAEVRTYRPLLDFGGWGIRFGGKGRAFNVSGNIGLQLVLKSGKRILIGTQQEEEMRKAIEEISPPSELNKAVL